MATGDKTTPQARSETDASLRTERDRTDEELARRGSHLYEGADAALRTERGRADRERSSARDKEDEKAVVTAQVQDERSRADRATAKERRDTDATLEAERIHQQIAIAGLLLAERQQTDARLLIERTRSDEILTHRDEFLAVLSHDMRTLLGVIALSAAILDGQKEPDASRVARSTASIKRATAQLTRLVADLLDIASFDSGKFALVRGLHDVGRIVREAASAFEPTTLKSGIGLSAEVPAESLIADCDPDRIAQVLANLLGNAAKFTRAGGKIVVRVARRESEIRLSVSDTGEGIPPDKLQTIFERYSQIRRNDRRGLGLGLYISRNIVEAHGGRLWAESIVGQGSTFFFTVPAAAKNA